MDDAFMAERLQAIEDRAKSNQRRIEKLEESTEVIGRLVTAIEVMAEKQDRVADSVEKLDGKVTALERKPSERWDSMVEKTILAVIAALIGFVLSEIGISG